MVMRWSVILGLAMCLFAACSRTESSADSATTPADVSSSADVAHTADATFPEDAICSTVSGEPGEACRCDGTCGSGARCIMTANHSPLALAVAVCVSADAGDCEEGFLLYNRCQPGFACTVPSRSEAGDGACLTYQQKAVLCSGPLAKHFACGFNTPLDASPYDLYPRIVP
jgi:hypothetical protein